VRPPTSCFGLLAYAQLFRSERCSENVLDGGGDLISLTGGAIIRGTIDRRNHTRGGVIGVTNGVDAVATDERVRPSTAEERVVATDGQSRRLNASNRTASIAG